MSDLADRLREDALVLDRFFYADDKGGKQSVALMREAADELGRLSARAAELEAVLRELEWSAMDGGCPSCGGLPFGPKAGHAPDCRLGRLLPPLPEEGK